MVTATFRAGTSGFHRKGTRYSRHCVLAENIFTNSPRDDRLLLLGRTGSGKSAIIYGLKDDIQNGINDVIELVTLACH